METNLSMESIVPAVAVFLVATVSPGPANLAIMTAAMRFGRRSGILLAAGVLCGSLFWGLLAASGLSFLIKSHHSIVSGIMILGGLYLAYLGYRAFFSFWMASSSIGVSTKNSLNSQPRLFVKGLAIHLTNPKSVLAWAAIVTIVIKPGSSALLPFLVVIGCWLLGVIVFFGYALIFSSRTMIDWYKKNGRWIDLGSSILFAVFSIKIFLEGLKYFW
jgi:threonine/homoserine/homoserine lactone efflux protein